ncbi:MAG: hypothetical protein H0U35_01800, partial [Sporichthyaceae bacterium]|nr:hypothetical protein [Sporichthyaceae bacterium]
MTIRRRYTNDQNALPKQVADLRRQLEQDRAARRLSGSTLVGRLKVALGGGIDLSDGGTIT